MRTPSVTIPPKDELRSDTKDRQGERHPELVAADTRGIAVAADRLKAGNVVAFPTETVYGLGADATNDRAVARIFEIKGRPAFNPLIIHVPSLEAASRWAAIPDAAETVATVYWPGPLTLVLPRRQDTGLSRLVSAGLDTVAIRVPSHPVALDLLAQTDRPIAAPSANRSGTISPTNPKHVVDSLGDRVPMILAGGRTTVGLESTVLDLTTDIPIILRPGVVTTEDLGSLIGPVQQPTVQQDTSPTAPGQLTSHYAPSLPVRMNAIDAHEGEVLITFGPDGFLGRHTEKLNLSSAGDLTEAAANLFAHLHALDRAPFTGIAVVAIPETGLGIAINDRLRRAAAPRPDRKTTP